MIFIIVLNIILSTLINIAFYPAIGIFIAIFSTLMVFARNTKIGHFFINRQMKNLSNNLNQNVLNDNALLMSVSCLSLSLKVGAAVTLFVEVSAVLTLTISILIAFGYLFEGSKSGMTPNLAYYIAKIFVKITFFLMIGFDTIAEWVAKIELRLLGIN